MVWCRRIVKTADSQEDALSVPCLKHFRNYSGPIKIARCGFPWQKTTKRPVDSVCTNCETAYAVISALRRRPSWGEGVLRKSVITLVSLDCLRSPRNHAGKRG